MLHNTHDIAHEQRGRRLTITAAAQTHPHTDRHADTDRHRQTETDTDLLEHQLYIAELLQQLAEHFHRVAVVACVCYAASVSVLCGICECVM